MKRSWILGVFFWALVAGVVPAAEPPEIINYQGILRDSLGNPVNGVRDMVFRFYDSDGGAPACPAAGGSLLLTESQLAAGTGDVTISDGLFNVLLGTGATTAGTATSLNEMFRDNQTVYMEIDIDDGSGAETLCPRFRVVSGGWALNADHLDGTDAAGFLDTSAASQTKDGDLSLGGSLSVTAGVDLGPGPDDDLAASDVTTLTGGGTADALHTHASVGNADTLDGNDSSFFIDSSAAAQVKSGDLSVADLTVSGNNLTFGGGAGFTDFGNALDLAVDPDSDDGAIKIAQDSFFRLTSGDGRFLFMNGASSAQTFSITNNGLVTVNDDLLVDGGDIFMTRFGSDGDQTLNFYEGGSYSESIRWDDASTRFVLSDDLLVGGDVELNGSVDLGAGTDDDLTAADVTTLTGGGAADALHTHAQAGDADTLDGNDSSFFIDTSAVAQTKAGDMAVLGNVGIGTTDPNQQLEITGNFRLPPTGIIFSGGTRMIHNFGFQSFFAGEGAGNRTMTGTGFNTGVGFEALVANTTGNSNLAVGYRALFLNTEGTRNASVGWLASQENTTGSENVAVGSASLLLSTTGDSNTAVGTDALFNNTTGSFNTAIGANTDVGAGGLTNATAIGANAIVDATNKIRLGDVDVTVVETDGSLYLGSEIRMNQDGPDGDQSIYFYEDSAETAEYLRWDNTLDEFYVSDSLKVDGDLFNLGTQFRMNQDGPDASQYLYFYENGSQFGEYFRWDDFNDEFYVSDAMKLGGNLFMNGQEITFYDPLGPTLRAYTGSGGRLEIIAGDDITDNLLFVAGISYLHGRIAMLGGENMEFRAGNNNFDFLGNLNLTGTKTFIQKHPYENDLSLAYVALEGAESATYVRGSGRLVDGVGRVRLEETFAWVTNPDIGLTAHVTPRGAWTDLYVESISTDELVVRSADPAVLDAAFDYLVFGLRIGYESHPVVRKRTHESTLPSETSFDARFELEPGIRVHNAMHRFTEMDAEVWGITNRDQSATRALRRGIGEYDWETKMAAVHAADESTAPVPRVDSSTRPAEADRQEASPPRSKAREAVPIDEAGDVYAASFRSSARELAVLMEITEGYEAGDVLSIDPEVRGMLSRSRQAADPTVFGVVAAGPGVMLGATRAATPPCDPASDPSACGPGAQTAQAPVIVSGVADCKVDAGYGAIRAGDLLTSAPTPGHAMRADDPRLGTILGKALEPLDAGTGRIRVLVTVH